jgi:hypothetical protein
MKVKDREIATLATHAAKTARQLDIGWKILIVSVLALSLTFLVWLTCHPARMPLLISALVIGSFQAYFALRVLIDATVFKNWSCRWQKGFSPVADLAAFDARIGRTPPTTSSIGENLAMRTEGAQRLLNWQAFFAGFQLLLLGLALWP